MREKFNHLYLDSHERKLLIHSLVELKNQLIQQGRYTDCIDELIFKVINAELNPVIGSEQGGTRPVLIISNDIGNKHSPTVIIAAITSRVHTKAKLPTHTPVSNYEGLDKDSVILLEQIRTIDKQRLKQYMGMMQVNRGNLLRGDLLLRRCFPI